MKLTPLETVGPGIKIAGFMLAALVIGLGTGLVLRVASGMERREVAAWLVVESAVIAVIAFLASSFNFFRRD